MTNLAILNLGEGVPLESAFPLPYEATMCLLRGEDGAWFYAVLFYAVLCDAPGTSPVLWCIDYNGEPLDESLEVMRWWALP